MTKTAKEVARDAWLHWFNAVPPGTSFCYDAIVDALEAAGWLRQLNGWESGSANEKRLADAAVKYGCASREFGEALEAVRRERAPVATAVRVVWKGRDGFAREYQLNADQGLEVARVLRLEP